MSVFLWYWGWFCPQDIGQYLEMFWWSWTGSVEDTWIECLEVTDAAGHPVGQSSTTMNYLVQKVSSAGVRNPDVREEGHCVLQVHTTKSDGVPFFFFFFLRAIFGSVLLECPGSNANECLVWYLWSVQVLWNERLITKKGHVLISVVWEACLVSISICK